MSGPVLLLVWTGAVCLSVLMGACTVKAVSWVLRGVEMP